MRIAGYFKGDAVGGAVQGIHIIHQPVMADVPFAHFMANDRLRGGNGGIIGDTLGQVVTEYRLCCPSTIRKQLKINEIRLRIQFLFKRLNLKK